MGVYRTNAYGALRKRTNGMKILTRLAVFLVWYGGAALIVSVALAWDDFAAEGGFLAVYLVTIGFGAMWAFTLGLPAWIITIWIGPRIRSALRRFLLVFVASVVLVTPGLTRGFTPDWREPNVLNDAIIVLGFVALIPLSLLVSYMLARVPSRPRREAPPELE